MLSYQVSVHLDLVMDHNEMCYPLERVFHRCFLPTDRDEMERTFPAMFVNGSGQNEHSL